MHTCSLAPIVLAVGSIAALGQRPVAAQVQPFPAGFHSQRIPTNSTTLYTRIGGTGPAVVLLHGYGETGDMWSPLAAKLAANHTVIVPDLRGMGLSARPSGGYDKKTQGHDVAGVLDALRIDRADPVTHDIGNMVGYAFAAEYPARVSRFVLIDAPLPGVGPWDDIVKSHALSVWSRAASGSTSTGSGTSSRPIRRSFRKPRARTMPGCTRDLAQCTPASNSSRPSIRTRLTTRRL